MCVHHYKKCAILKSIDVISTSKTVIIDVDIIYISVILVVVFPMKVCDCVANYGKNKE